MPLLIAGAVVSVGSAVAQGVTGMKQMRDARRAQENLVRPEFQIPPEIFENMSLAERRMYQGLPDAQKREFLNNLQNQSQQALSQATTRKAGLGLVSDLYAQEQSGINQLLMADVQAREQNIEKAMSARREVAQARMMEFEHDFNLYTSDLDYARSQESAGMQNVFGALDTIGATAASLGGQGIGVGENTLARLQNTNTAPGTQTSESISPMIQRLLEENKKLREKITLQGNDLGDFEGDGTYVG